MHMRRVLPLILSAGREKEPLAHLLGITVKLASIECDVALFDLNQSFAPLLPEDEFRLESVVTASARDEPIAMDLLEVQANDVFTILGRY